MKNNKKKLLYVLGINHPKWLKKSVKFGSRAIYVLNQMSKCSGIKEITDFWKTANWLESGKGWFKSNATWFESCVKVDSNQMPQIWQWLFEKETDSNNV